MFPTSVKPINKESLADLDKVFKTAYKTILSQIEGATSFGTANRKQILAQIEQILTELGTDVNKFIETEIPEQYRAGAVDAIKQLDKVGGEASVTTGFNVVHKQVIEALVDETGKSFAEAMSGVNRNIIQTINQSVKDQISQDIATGRIAGDTTRAIKGEVLQRFKENGFTALKSKPFTNKNGTVIQQTWDLETYTGMLIQTKTTEARNRGLVNRMVENTWDLVQVSAHGASDACGDWEGKILSISGETPGYPTLDSAKSSGLFHPNCRHAINVINPEIAELTHAYDSQNDTLSAQEGQEALKESQYTVFRGEGGDNPASGLAAYGRGRYYSFDKGYAAAFGEVKESQIILKKPLVLKTPDDLQKATDNRIRDNFETIAEWAKSKGYDGLIDEVSEILLKF